MAARGLAFTMVSAGDRYSCGVTTSRAAYCWGSNANGQLGNETFTDTATGDIYCWGNNGSGQLGNDTTTEQRVTGESQAHAVPA